jgi:hypothetical protein
VQECVLHANDDIMHEEAPSGFKYPFVHGIAPPHQGIHARISNRLCVRRFPRDLGDGETIYGGQTENLTHLEDKRSPNAHILDVFPMFFEKAPYGFN